MKTIAAVLLATVVASPVLAQSYDPDLGTGNVAPIAATTLHRRSIHSTFGEARAQAFGIHGRVLFDRTKGNIE